jgi:hypothetical protein
MGSLFSTGLDVSGWGLTEWLIAGGGAFLLLGGTKLLGGRRRNPARRRNIAAGFWRNGRFHPIRSSWDYSPARAHESESGRARYSARKSRKKKGWRY